MKDIIFETVIYPDALTLLLGKTDIRAFYDETDACRGTGAAAFLIRCRFDTGRYLRDTAGRRQP